MVRHTTYLPIVQEVVVAEHNAELRVGAVEETRSGHVDGATSMPQHAAVHLEGEPNARSTAAISRGITPLGHKSFNH